ncbi:astacin-like metallopeptidase 2 protein, partial [Dinothrombium tinctorium]
LGYYDPNVFYNTSRFEGDIIRHPLVNFLELIGISLKFLFTQSNDTFGIYHATSDRSVLWPNGELVYHIDYSLYPHQFLIKSAMDHISSRTGNCIKFKKRTFETAYVYVYSNQGCYSAIGRQGDAQELSLGQGCHVMGVVIHEFLHALGFYHYHSRSDRDQYLRINYQNIIPSMMSQFQMLSPFQNQIFTDFDYESIMIYGSTAFSRDGRSPTMVPLKAGVYLRDPGYKYSLTEKDVISIKKLYGCA